MNFTIKNENYGYSVATYGDYVAIGSPPSFLSGSGFSVGQVSVKKYNYSNNEYENYLTLQKTLDQDTSHDFNLSQSDDANFDLTTEDGKYLKYDLNDNYSINKVENEYGHSLSIYGNDLAVATRYFTCSVVKPTIVITGSNVDIYDLSTLAIIPKFTITSSFNDETGSFGYNVSVGKNVLAIGCIGKYNNKGAVYIYNKSGSVWNYAQTLTGSNSVSGDCFGYSLKLDPSGSNKLIVGNSSSVSSFGSVYIFESSSLGWTQNSILNADNDFNYVLPHVNVYPYSAQTQSYNGFGYSVSIYGDKAIVGCPFESQYLEYSESLLRKRGSAFLYYKCNLTNKWVFDSKFYSGIFDENDAVFKDNKLGYKVDIFENYCIASSLKWNYPYSSSYISGTLNNVLYNESLINYYNTLGYVYLYQYQSGSWSSLKNLSRIKNVGNPYSVYGYDVSLSDKSIVVGSPCLLSTLNRTITSSVENYRNIRGYSFVYNFDDFVADHHIGNSFYRNGALVIKTNGSIFDNIMTQQRIYDDPLPYYNLKYNSQITLHENQTICQIMPGEFNVSTNPTAVYRDTFTYDINQDKKFDFQDVDLILRYMCNLNLGNEQWWNVVIENDYETSLFNYYSGLQSDIQNAPISRTVSNYFSGSLLTSEYSTYLNGIKDDLDTDGNGSVNINDMFILWQYFSHQLTDNIYKTLVTPKSKRSKYTDLLNYLDTKTSKINPSYITPEFFNYQYSSSVDNTGSFLAPYITTVGLYSGTDLVAIGKLGTPIKNSGDFPINILVKWDV